MSRQQNFQLMASYNRWMNDRLYEVASSLTAADLAKDRGAFFESILGTLNHILVEDTIWLKRFAGHPCQFTLLQHLNAISNPTALNEILFSDFNKLHAARPQKQPEARTGTTQ